MCLVSDYTLYIVVSDSGEHASTVSDLIKAVNIRSISSCLALTRLMYTTLFTYLRRKNIEVLGREI